MPKSFLNPETLPSWPEFFSNIVVVEKNGIKTIYLAGQLGIDENKNLVGEGDFIAQAKQSFTNIQLALANVNAKMTDIVKLTIFVKNYSSDLIPVVGQLLAEYFPEQKPACTLLGVQSLAEERFLIEIEAIAVQESDN
ncbi:MAG TPA: RidA family protein [Nostocaceae cyanobacterium]|nr:RidA family protein [Nostocaceae cyanobacterium]